MHLAIPSQKPGSAVRKYLPARSGELGYVILSMYRISSNAYRISFRRQEAANTK